MTHDSTPRDPDAGRRLLRAALLGLTISAWGLLVGIVVWRAWVCDDAYITFRVVDNFLHGHGLRWNVDERVQVYTHPLWMLLHIPLVAIFGNVFLVTVALSATCSVAAVAVAQGTFRDRPWAALLLLLVPLLTSRAFLDYTTSGLENPLSYLLFALFAWLVVQPRRRWGLLILVASLATLNRLDCVLLYLPVLTWMLVRGPTRPRLRSWLGTAPLVLWIGFATFYYGTPVPNTFFAKLSAGLPRSLYLRQGRLYFTDLLMTDAPTLIAVVVAVTLALGSALRDREADGSERRFETGMIAAGVLLYVGYVFSVGGDFMSGRFLAVPLFAAAWLLYAMAPKLPDAQRATIVALLVVGFFLKPPYHPFLATYLGDQRGLYARAYSLFTVSPEGGLGLRTGLSDHPYVHEHGDFLARRGDRPALVIRGAIGIFGYYAGPDVIVIDNYALSDALLARLPWHARQNWTVGVPVGHLPRGKPRGFVEARLTGSSDGMSPLLRPYYRALRRLTSGPLGSWGRLRTLVAFQLGAWDDDLAAYVAREYAQTEEKPGGHAVWIRTARGVEPDPGP